MSSDGGHRLLPSKRPHPGSPPGRSEEEKKSGAEVIFVSVSHRGGPIGHAIYALPLPVPKYDPSPILRHHREHKSGGDMYPILEIPSDLCHPTMRCVKFKSRLYYIGATSFLDHCLREFHPNVCFIELDHLYAAAATGAPLPPVSDLLKPGVSMRAGKPNCYAFVVDNKLYAIGPSLCPVDENQFEVFDPETSQWSTLPSGPLYSAVTGHALIDDNNNKKLLFSTLGPTEKSYGRKQSAYFDLETNQWVQFHPRKAAFQSVMPAVSAGGSLYFRSHYHLSSTGPIRSDGGIDLSRLFDEDVAMASPELSALVNVELNHSMRMFHLGNNTFLYVMWIKIPDPEYPPESLAMDEDKVMIRVVVFEVTGERFPKQVVNPQYNYCKPRGPQLVFPTKVLRSVDYLGRSKTPEIEFSASYIDECFLGSPILTDEEFAS